MWNVAITYIIKIHIFINFLNFMFFFLIKNISLKQLLKVLLLLLLLFNFFGKFHSYALRIFKVIFQLEQIYSFSKSKFSKLRKRCNSSLLKLLFIFLIQLFIRWDESIMEFIKINIIINMAYNEYILFVVQVFIYISHSPNFRLVVFSLMNLINFGGFRYSI